MKTYLFLLLATIALCVSGLQPLRAADSAPASTPEGTDWILREMHGKPVAPSGERGLPTLKLDAAKKHASGFTGVNRFFGGYERTGEKLKFSALGATDMAGPPEQMAVEAAFHAALGKVSHWHIRKGALELLQGETVLLLFTVGAAVK